MGYGISLTDGARADIEYFEARERRIIVAGILTHLSTEAEASSRRRKQLRPNPIAPWVLRVEDYRVFYVVGKDAFVTVVAVGRKEHNDLMIRGKKVEL